MRTTDLSPDRRQNLVRSEEYPNVHAFVPPPTPRRLPAQGLDRALQRAHEALGTLAQSVLHLPEPDLITRTLARREAVHSSQIEGTQAGLDTLYEYECTGSAEHLPADVRTTRNYVDALELGLRAIRGPGGRQALSLALVQDMHRVLMTGTDYPDVPGRFRTRQNWIGGRRIENATFVPPPPQEVPRCMEELEASMLRYAPREDEPFSLSAVVQMAIAHAQFETVHPFRDGNGRVGRLLLPLILEAERYPPLYLSGYLHRHQRDYYAALAGVQLRGEWQIWVEFLAEAVVVSCQEAIALAQDLLAIRQRWDGALAGLRSDAAARKLPTLLLGHPVTSVKEIGALLDISFPAANAALGALVEKGMLEAPEGRKRNRIFVAREIIERLERN
ncbi:MAG: filamentation induced by cAMP protein Fic [Moraxellaceae bacterium]|jgi:Fic family protein|nr:filamentation induced by cAMP protein Fic [Moraxellaceae bacterium]